MDNTTLTDREKLAFSRDITRGLTLDYFYTFDNVPLHFIYRDGIEQGSFSELEKRNKAITESVWLDAYNLNVVCNIHYIFLYRPEALMLPLQAFYRGNRIKTVRSSSIVQKQPQPNGTATIEECVDRA